MSTFEKGQRVRPSERGIAANIFPKTRQQQSGVVVRVNSPFVHVLWDDRKTPLGYHPDFIAPDERAVQRAKTRPDA